MPKDDRSPGDARKPYSDIGGPEARHAQTHDVARERHTNPTGPEPGDPVVDELLEGQTPDVVREAHLDATAGSDSKDVANALPELNADELSQLSVLKEGTPLEQGATYLDLNDRAAGPFTAVGGRDVESGAKIVAKKLTDYELWNRLTGEERD